jgi:DNA replication protein DnaC
VLIGGPGTGKAHIAAAFWVQAVEHHRRKVRFLSTIELVNPLEQEKAKGKAGQLAESLVRLGLPILPSRQHALRAPAGKWMNLATYRSA